jgi:hypothetical protein
VTTWTTGEAAEKCVLSQHTLRWYERIGLLAKITHYGTCLAEAPGKSKL